jgi:hypothetical protein
MSFMTPSMIKKAIASPLRIHPPQTALTGARFSLIVEALARLCVPVQLTVGPQRAAARLTGGKRTARWARAMRCPAATQGSPPVRLPGALCTRTRGLARGTEGHSSGVLAAARGGYPKKASCADRLERSNIGGGGVSAHVIVS